MQIRKEQETLFRGGRLRRGILLAVMIGMCAGPLAACREQADREVEATAPSSTHEPTRAVPAVEDLVPRTRFAEIAKTVGPVVVQLKTVQEVREPWYSFHRHSRESFLKSVLKRLLGLSKELVIRQEGVGSGFIVHPAGYVLTNFHVVNRADEIQAVFSDGREIGARVVAEEPRTDLALLRLEEKGPYPAAILGDSDHLESGEWAMAAGSPLGLAQTFTVGVISATGRSHLGIASRENFIQTDASINYGNSGGPLLNINAEVVGINTAIMPTGHGIGFAIPINMARRFFKSVLEAHPVQSAWLGMEARPSTAEGENRNGVIVRSVEWKSPAWRSGLRPEDRVIRVDDTDISDAIQLKRLIADGGIGVERTLTVDRSGIIEEVPIRTAEWPLRVFP
jgi:S1-C subfamily serine protease